MPKKKKMPKKPADYIRPSSAERIAVKSLFAEFAPFEPHISICCFFIR